MAEGSGVVAAILTEDSGVAALCTLVQGLLLMGSLTEHQHWCSVI